MLSLIQIKLISIFPSPEGESKAVFCLAIAQQINFHGSKYIRFEVVCLWGFCLVGFVVIVFLCLFACLVLFGLFVCVFSLFLTTTDFKY